MTLGSCPFAGRFLAIGILFVLLLGTFEGASETNSLALTVNPPISNSPGVFRTTATVEPHAANRWLVVRAESTEYYRSSTIQLHGAQAPRTHEMFFERLPSGQYVIEARVERSNGQRIVREAVVQVVGPKGRR